MNDEELTLWLCDHPLLMGTEYQHDIGKLKGILFYCSMHNIERLVFICNYRGQNKWQ